MSCLIKTSNEYDRVNGLIVETVSLLCKNGLSYTKQLKVQGVLAVTIDENEIFLVHINESIDYTPEVESAKNNHMHPPLTLLQSKNYTLMDDHLASDGDQEEMDDYGEGSIEPTEFNGLKETISTEFRESCSDTVNVSNSNNIHDSSGRVGEYSEKNPSKDHQENIDNSRINELMQNNVDNNNDNNNK